MWRRSCGEVGDEVELELELGLSIKRGSAAAVVFVRAFLGFFLPLGLVLSVYLVLATRTSS